MSPTIRKQKLADLFAIKIFENIEIEVVKEISELTGKQKIIDNLKMDSTEVSKDDIQKIQEEIKRINNNYPLQLPTTSIYYKYLLQVIIINNLI